ncbi:hypothetical protein CMUS01_06946 [Colletotrichum musicola]|uniref:Uncharacterized protein n=1 Tax=Colletotrichum musicola TaxID=2175873 RepID=A0A8H6KJE2_9PEZI|nr:hypothetical protein CMUS01_06946 [Colletotrichum musicola]
MHSSPGEIQAAVKAYRARIAGHNRRIMEAYMPLITTAELDPDDYCSGDEEEDVSELRMEGLMAIFDRRLTDFISTPAELLDHWDELVARYDLDGTGGVVDEEHLTHCEEYFTHLEAALEATCREDVRDDIAVPEEFRELAKHVRGLTGPGFTEEYKSRYQALFWPGPNYGQHAAKRVAGTARTPAQLGDEFNAFWEYAGGWEPGCGYDCFFSVVYCRRRAEPGRETTGPWVWRYESNDPMDPGGFDTIPELLEWYAGYRERGVPDVGEFTGEDFFRGGLEF